MKRRNKVRGKKSGKGRRAGYLVLCEFWLL